MMHLAVVRGMRRRLSGAQIDDVYEKRALESTCTWGHILDVLKV